MTTTTRWVCLALSSLLVFAALTDRNLAYASFHAVAALTALAAAWLAQGRGAPAFLLFFGLIDLYQALASAAGWFPQALFLWSPTDDVIHWSLGSLLVILGGAALAVQRKKRK